APWCTRFPYTTLFRSGVVDEAAQFGGARVRGLGHPRIVPRFPRAGKRGAPARRRALPAGAAGDPDVLLAVVGAQLLAQVRDALRSEEHTSELQSRENL